jgi:uncharacterized protein YggE
MFFSNVILPLFMLSTIAGEERLIRVSGDALVEVPPDYAIVRLNLEARDRLLKRARVTHTADLDAVLQVAARHKISNADLAQDFPEIDSRADGFLVRRTIQLTVRDLKDYDALLFELYDSAALTVESVEFRLNDLVKHRERAREMAITAAETKVNLMVKAMKRRVGRVMEVEVESGGGSLLRRGGMTVDDGRGSGIRATQNVTFVAPPSSGSGSSLFRVPVTAKVDAQYEILD